MKHTAEFVKDVFITSLKFELILFYFSLMFFGFVLFVLCAWEYVLVCGLCFFAAAICQLLYLLYKAISEHKEEQAKKELERLRLAEKNKVKYVIIK